MVRHKGSYRLGISGPWKWVRIGSRVLKSRYLEVEEILSSSFLVELLRLVDNKLCRIVGGRFLRVNITLTSHYLTTEKQSTSFFTSINHQLLRWEKKTTSFLVRKKKEAFRKTSTLSKRWGRNTALWSILSLDGVKRGVSKVWNVKIGKFFFWPVNESFSSKLIN